MTFGGGNGTTKIPSAFGEPSWATWGLKNPCASHQSYQAASTACGLYPAAIGWERSAHASETQRENEGWETFLLALGSRVDERGFVCLVLFLCLGLLLACWRGCNLLELLRSELGLLFQSLGLLLGWHRVSLRTARGELELPELLEGAPSISVDMLATTILQDGIDRG